MTEDTTLQEVESQSNSNEIVHSVFTERSHIIRLKHRSKLKRLRYLPRVFVKQFILLSGVPLIQRISLSYRLAILVLKG